MPTNEITNHLIIDIKTGASYGVQLDAEGNCTKKIQVLNTAIETADERLVTKFGSAKAGLDATPHGKTIYGVEMKSDGTPGQFFTVTFPAKKDAEAGILPTVAKKDQPDDLVKAGIAPSPKGAAKGAKGAAVTDDEALKESLKNIDDMIGLDTAKRDIKQNIAVARFNRVKEEMGLATKPISRHMVFTGNPGTGKTTFAREVAKVYHSLGFIDKPTVHEVKREDLVAGYVGQTALKVKEQIEKAKGGILFIDEAYALSSGSGSGSSGADFGKEAIDTLVAAMENMREDLIVVVAGYPEPMKRFIDANEGLKSRFMTYISFDDYSLTQLGQIMDFMLKERGYTMTEDARALAMKLMEEDKTKAGKSFGNGRTARNLVEKAEKELAMRLVSENKLVRDPAASDEDFKKTLTTLTVDDIRKVSLQGIGASAAPSIGFGKKAQKAGPEVKADVPQNDNTSGGHMLDFDMTRTRPPKMSM
jgi:stage V sporulation protein K